MRRRSTDTEKGGRRGERAPYVGSAILHLAVFALAMWASMTEPRELNAITYQIDIVSPPATSPKPIEDQPPAQEEELVVEQPDPEPVVEEEKPVIQPEPERKEVKAEVPERTQPAKPVEKPVEKPAEKPVATDSAATRTSGEDLRVRMEGLQRDFPEYYANIIRQIRRCLRWQGGGNLEAQVYFVIRRDGTLSTRDLDIVRKSGNIRFDVTVLEAVECAGGRFGALPEELPYDQLPVLFNFRPDR